MSGEETLLEFPCHFPIKAMGKSSTNFDTIVVGIVSQYVDGIKEGAVKIKSSKGGKYSSVTITIEATSKQQLDAIYQGLTDCSKVLMAL